MIEVYEGRIGGGKSYSAVKRMAEYLSVGGCVCTNINLQMDELKAYLLRRYKWELKEGQVNLLDEGFIDYEHPNGKTERIKKIAVFHKFTPKGTKSKPVLVVIDEAHFHFPNNQYGKVPKETVEFLTMSRHHHTDVILITQHIKNMTGQFQRLCEYVWRFRDMQRFGIPLQIGFAELCIPWPFPHIRQNRNDFAGNYMSGGFVKKDVEIFALYKSPDLINGFERTEAQTDFSEEKKSKKGLTMKEKIIFVILGVFIGVVGFSVWLPKQAEANTELVEVETFADVDRDLNTKKGVQDLEAVITDIEVNGSASVDGKYEIWIAGEVLAVGSRYNGKQIVFVSDKEFVLMADDGATERIRYKVK